MKTLITAFLALFIVSSSTVFAQSEPQPVAVSDADAVFLFRYVGGPFDGLPEDSENQILHSELLMCSILFNLGNKMIARCSLPYEQKQFDKDNAVVVTQILKKYGMPSNFKLGYETVEGGLDCTNALSGKEYPKCFLTPKSLE